MYSFGLSYPGYFFVVIPDEDGDFTIYKVHETNRFRAAELANQFLARHATIYIAHPVPGEHVTDYYSVVESVRSYIATDNFYYNAEETSEWQAFELSTLFTAEEEYPFFKAAENERIFYAIESSEYAEIYRS